ncbi:glycosyltransferase [Mucilaginibacter arboris]|uniref:Glycosyltransferase n=1 Tax=Mucilaginibacter arboris TaxID=2682090 RepID=A0A7K1SXK5_9SPHI|nr:glycosyltransferase [Mucilaginibacter arboris]MVN22043.1 glycosyltransferase [Mucilaginibacter arboris]
MKLSIIVPVYNKSKYINRCIQSILSQTFTDFELILVNDGSTDDSGDRCNFYAILDSRVVVIHQNNHGVSAARNAGLNIARGTYIGFVDCDDEIDPDMYSTLINTAKHYDADISICGVRKVFPYKVELYYGTNAIKVYNKIEAIGGLFKKKFSRSVCDKIYKAEIAKKIKFEGYMNEDTFYNFLIFIETNKIVFNDVIKYNYLIRDNSVTMTKFSKKDLDTIFFSERMIKICEEKLPELIYNAKYYDLVNNISLLNLILMSKKELHLNEYNHVVRNLDNYSNYVNKNSIKSKHKYAYNIFKLNPTIYEFLMKTYCKITNADVSKKNN